MDTEIWDQEKVLPIWQYSVFRGVPSSDVFPLQRCSLFGGLWLLILKFGTKKECSLYGGVPSSEVFPIGGFTVCTLL